MQRIIEQIINLVMKFLNPKQEYYDKVVVKYESIKGKQATGTLFFKELQVPFISGRHGKGYAPQGEYFAYQFINETRGEFMTHSIGWQVPIEPQFKTDRTFLAIHPDGNIKGTLGCIGVEPKDIEDAIRLRNAFRNYFDIHRRLEVTIG